ncbi:MAG TPA: threonine synthase [Acetobacteraceae bacterium]|jgi:threonine synthase|nr:threonine synthase [Acetobacteraceae bacterium]
MRYVSTRGRAPVLDFAGVLLAGLAEDGGLYVPETWPSFSAAEIRALRGLPYAALAARVMAPFVGAATPDLERLCKEVYAGFDHPAVVPLMQLETGLWVQELFHGPTLAFKDLALQLVGRMFEEVLQGERLTIVGATSGDTGAAAIEALKNRSGIAIAILHPKGRVSEVQRRQMTTTTALNVANIAIEGSFDDCQDLVKAMFADAEFRREMRLSAVNSINWARIAAQIPYYFAAALALGAPEREVAFSVPTGNFGNVLAAWVAARMGLPIAGLIVACNQNDILARFLAVNDMSVRPVVPSVAPSMDIQVSSNFERLLFELVDRDPEAVERIMLGFRREGRMAVPAAAWQRMRAVFSGFALDDAGTEAEIGRLHRVCGYLADPHSAIGIAAARDASIAGRIAPSVPRIAAATAHPAKFAPAVERASGVRPTLPARLADLYQRPEHYAVAGNDLVAVEGLVRALAERTAGLGIAA